MNAICLAYLRQNDFFKYIIKKWNTADNQKIKKIGSGESVVAHHSFNTLFV
jgi:hypothetical protein